MPGIFFPCICQTFVANYQLESVPRLELIKMPVLSAEGGLRGVGFQNAQWGFSFSSNESPVRLWNSAFGTGMAGTCGKLHAITSAFGIFPGTSVRKT